MRYRGVPALAVLLWIGVSVAGQGAEIIADPPAGKDVLSPMEVRASCNTIAAILTVYPTFVVETSDEAVQGLRGGPGRAGCRVRATAPTWGLVGEVPPGWALRDLMGQLGWKEDPRHAADGTGTASFALRKERVLCIVGEGAPAGIDEGKAERARIYELEAGCAADPDP